MNPSATTTTEEVTPGSPDEVIRLKCPSCTGGLNLQRRHLGISGSCVHCKSPIRAVEMPNGAIIAETPGQSAAPAPEAPTSPTASQAPPARNEPPPAAAGVAPPSQPDFIEQSDRPARESEPPQGGSPWGFPKPIGDKSAFAPPPTATPAESTSRPEPEAFAAPTTQEAPSLFGTHERVIENVEPSSDAPLQTNAPAPPAESNTAFGMPDGFANPTHQDAPSPFGTRESDIENVEPEPKTTSEPHQPAQVTAFGMPVKPEAATDSSPDAEESSNSPFGSPFASHPAPSDTATPPAGTEPTPEESKPKKTVPPLFAQSPGKSRGASLFEDSEEVTAITPTSSTTPTSPFSNPSSSDEPQQGFAEALFPKEPAPEVSVPPTASPPAPDPPSEFGPPKVSNKEELPEQEPAPPAKSDRPSRVFKGGTLSGVASTVTKLMRILIVLTLLAGFGYAGFILTPPEKVAQLKVKIREWLKPGAVLKDYLPFEVSLWEEEPATKDESAVPEAQTTKEVPAPPAPAPVETGPVSTEELPAGTPKSGPDPTIRPAPAVTPDQIADSLPAE